ncbi:hypothetical protein ACIP6P_02190 [Streptomyces sp. NPDC088729]|uniref:hypothetical protein n=1 Tax=Streptomyces sp. NPDC088729 TaxID=3365876 RepID=UPI0038306D93
MNGRPVVADVHTISDDGNEVQTPPILRVVVQRPRDGRAREPSSCRAPGLLPRLKQWRGLAMRTDKLAIACQAALHLAAILIRARR